MIGCEGLDRVGSGELDRGLRIIAIEKKLVENRGESMEKKLVEDRNRDQSIEKELVGHRHVGFVSYASISLFLIGTGKVNVMMPSRYRDIYYKKK